MEIKASLNNLRTSPRKVRLVIDLVRGLKVDKALDQLKFTKKKSCLPISKLIKSAVANAVNNFGLDADNLMIKEIRVDEGSTLKRWMPRAHGRATTIRKRSSHINITLAEIKESGVKKAKKQKIDAPIKLDDLMKGNNKKKDTKKKEVKDDNISKDDKEEKTAEANDPRMEAKGGHGKAEGGSKGFSKNIFRRKSG